MRRLEFHFCLVTWMCVTSPHAVSPLAPDSQVAADQTIPNKPGFAEHLARLTKRVPEGFTVAVQPPFVVLGDEPPEVVRQRATRTVKWAVDLLKQDFFHCDPLEIVDIWLFRDRSSYMNHAHLLFHDIPSSSFGALRPSLLSLLLPPGKGAVGEVL